MAASPSEVDQLFGLPLRDFTRARAALAARLEKAGQREEAARIKALPKPSLPVWAINQIARRDRLAVERLIRAVEAVKRGQLGEGGPVAAAVESQQNAMRQLRDKAAEALKAGGMKATTDTLERISRTLLGAAVSAPDDLRHGRLTAEVPLPGFEALTGAAPKVRRLKPLVRPPDRREETRLRERVERARASLRAAEARADQAKKRAAQLEEEAEKTRKAAEEAARDEKHAREETENAAARVREAAQVLQDAEGALARSQRTT